MFTYHIQSIINHQHDKSMTINLQNDRMDEFGGIKTIH
jgi:hypothetical protein